MLAAKLVVWGQILYAEYVPSLFSNPTFSNAELNIKERHSVVNLGLYFFLLFGSKLLYSS